MKTIEKQTKRVVAFLFILGIICVVTSLNGCGRKADPVCNMTWSCGTNACAYNQGAWSGSGSFTGTNDESDCLAWETAFLNGTGYPYNKVTACTCTQ